MKSMLLPGGFFLFLSVSLLTRLCLFCLIVCSVQHRTSTAPYEHGYTGPEGGFSLKL